MDKTIGILIIRDGPPNETGVDHFDVAPGVSVDVVEDMGAFMAPYCLEDWKAQLGTVGWDRYIDSRSPQKWVITIEVGGCDARMYTWAQRLLDSLKIAVFFPCYMSAHFLSVRSENGITPNTHDDYELSTWFNSQDDGGKTHPMTREIFNRWMDFTIKMHPSPRSKEYCVRSKRFIEGVDLFSKGLEADGLMHRKYPRFRLNCFVLALEALIRSEEGLQKECFLSRIRCFWPQDQPELLPLEKASQIIEDIFLMKNRDNYLTDVEDGKEILESHWRTVVQAEQLARSAYSMVLSSPEHLACFTDGQRLKEFWATWDSRSPIQTSISGNI